MIESIRDNLINRADREKGWSHLFQSEVSSLLVVKVIKDSLIVNINQLLRLSNLWRIILLHV